MIQLKNVTLRRSAKVLLDAASVTLNPGEKVGLVGRNGAGKSTLMKILTGVYTRDSGTVKIEGQIADLYGAAGAERAGVAMIFQEFSLIGLILSSGSMGPFSVVSMAMACPTSSW